MKFLAIIICCVLTALIGCKNNQTETTKSEGTDTSQGSAKTGSSVLIIHNGKEMTFFNRYFDSIISADIITNMDTLIVSGTENSVVPNDIDYSTNFGFYASLIEIPGQESLKTYYLSVISADENIWGSQYQLSLFEKTQNEIQLIDQVFMPNMMDSINVSYSRALKNYNIYIHYQADLTSEIASSGTHHWCIVDGRLLLNEEK